MTVRMDAAGDIAVGLRNISFAILFCIILRYSGTER